MSTQRWSGRVRQLVEELVKAFSQVIQVPASRSSVVMRDFYFENPANSAENLHDLDKGRQQSSAFLETFSQIFV